VGNPFSHLNDKQLMKHYQQGESMAFEILYERHQSKVYSYLFKRLKEKEVIDDVFQNIFAKFHKARQKYDSKFEVLQWIYTISRNELLDYSKKKKLNIIELRDEHAVIEKEEIDLPFSIEEESVLNEKEREVLKLKYFSDSNYKEISEALNSNESNIRKITSRALKKLKLKYARGESHE
jgi:RNA polymerase sigma-70 factor (ECF subfamily)